MGEGHSPEVDTEVIEASPSVLECSEESELRDEGLELVTDAWVEACRDPDEEVDRALKGTWIPKVIFVVLTAADLWNARAGVAINASHFPQRQAAEGSGFRMRSRPQCPDCSVDCLARDRGESSRVPWYSKVFLLCKEMSALVVPSSRRRRRHCRKLEARLPDQLLPNLECGPGNDHAEDVQREQNAPKFGRAHRRLHRDLSHAVASAESNS